MRADQAPKLSTIGWLLGILVVLSSIAALHATAWLSSTLAIAFFIALAIWPVDAFIRHRTPRGFKWLGHVGALALMLTIFALFIGSALLAASQITASLPKYGGVVQAWIERLGAWADVPRDLGGDGGVLTERLVNPVVGFASTAVQSMSNLAGILSLIFFLVLLMLMETPMLAAKLQSATTRRHGKEYQTVLLAIATRVRWYLAVRTVLGLATGVLYALWSWWWGLDFIVVWGLLAFLLNYIPTVGSLVAGILPATFAFLQIGPSSAVLYAAGLLLIEQVMGNYVDPKLQGRELALSPLAVLIALFFWTWVWGLAGALVAVPMTLVVMFVLAKIPPLLPAALFLSNCKDADDLEAAMAL